MNENIRITREVLKPESVLSTLKNDDCGAVVSFIGTVRNTSNDGKPVSYLDIELAGEDAEAKLREIASEISRKWHLRPQDILIHRRIGRLAVGEIGLIVGIAAVHRPEAFAACAHVVDRIKAGHITVEKDLPG
jgi:molybdopterin synthase catalytic subunit